MHPHLQPHSRTLSIVRFLRAAGPLPRRRRLPRQQQPDAIRKAYFDAIMPFVNVSLRIFAQVRPEIVRLLQDQRFEDQARMDAPRKQRAKELVDTAARRAANAFAPTDLAAVARKFGKRTSEFQREQLDQQVRAALSVPLSVVEKPITDKLEGFAAVNVDLIKTVPERYFDSIRGEVEDAFESGMHPDTLAEILEERDGVAESDARRIARDQIGKLNAQFNEERQEAMGVTGYTWRTMNDSRVRDEHQYLEGQHFDWDDPPSEGNPGEPIQCRCFAEPDFAPIVDGLDES